jgi:hypothetical protein
MLAFVNEERRHRGDCYVVPPYDLIPEVSAIQSFGNANTAWSSEATEAGDGAVNRVAPSWSAKQVTGTRVPADRVREVANCATRSNAPTAKLLAAVSAASLAASLAVPSTNSGTARDQVSGALNAGHRFLDTAAAPSDRRRSGRAAC